MVSSQPSHLYNASGFAVIGWHQLASLHGSHFATLWGSCTAAQMYTRRPTVMKAPERQSLLKNFLNQIPFLSWLRLQLQSSFPHPHAAYADRPSFFLTATQSYIVIIIPHCPFFSCPIFPHQTSSLLIIPHHPSLYLTILCHTSSDFMP